MKGRLLFIAILDSALALIALYAAAYVRFGYEDISTKLLDQLTIYTAVIFILVSLFSSNLMDVYDPDRNRKKREIAINSLLGSTASFFLLSIIYYLDPRVMLGRGILVLSIFLFTLFQVCTHVLFIMAGSAYPRRSRRILILGTGPLASQIGDIIASHTHSFTLAGYTTSNSNGTFRNGAGEPNPTVAPDAIIGNSHDLLETVASLRADTIVIALSERRGVFPLADVLRCKMNGIEILDAPSFYELAHSKLMLEQMTPSWIIFSSGFHRTSLFSSFKRGMDILLSLTGLVLTAPFTPLIALAIKLDSPGPVFFKQIRVGNNEKLFTLYKFRTMRQDAEQQSGAVWSTKNDPRVTRLGLFLRNTRIDEIPQLYNVLKGEMSFIGPRPERPEFVEQLKQVIPYYSKRHFIKPGLTGWAQVRYPYGSSIEDAIEKLRYDLYYTKNISPFMDTLIFFETIKVVLFGRGGR